MHHKILYGTTQSLRVSGIFWSQHFIQTFESPLCLKTQCKHDTKRYQTLSLLLRSMNSVHSAAREKPVGSIASTAEPVTIAARICKMSHLNRARVGRLKWMKPTKFIEHLVRRCQSRMNDSVVCRSPALCASTVCTREKLHETVRAIYTIHTITKWHYERWLATRERDEHQQHIFHEWTF